MSNFLDRILTHAPDPAQEAVLLKEIAAHADAVRGSAGRGKRGLVQQAESAVQRDPAGAFTFDGTGTASLAAAGHTWSAGRFETPSIGELRESVRPRAAGARARLWVLDGASPVTDIGSLQATSGDGALFQVASQFNCLESPGPYVTNVANYLKDPTQGPRASISAFPATLLRHYAAPGPGGQRFVQKSNGPQIELLADALGAGAAPSGYFTGKGAADPRALVSALEDHFDAIRVGVHDAAQVVLGGNWDGAVENSERTRIAQVFTSTVAGGMYAGEKNLGVSGFQDACRQLLRAAYLGTLLAAASLGRSRVVLTLIGGGVFRNPIPLIWSSIQWAIDEVQPLLSQDMEVIVNGWNLGSTIDFKAEVLPVVRAHGGVICRFDSAGQAVIER